MCTHEESADDGSANEPDKREVKPGDDGPGAAERYRDEEEDESDDEGGGVAEADPKPRTWILIGRWKLGDEGALNELMERHLPAIRAQVNTALGAELRRYTGREDIVQNVVLQLLRYLPQFRISKDSSFQAFVAKIVINVIRDQNDWWHAARRDISLEVPIDHEGVLSLDPPRDRVDTPSEINSAAEREAWIRIAMLLIDPEDRKVIELRVKSRWSFKKIGDRLNISEEAARKRYSRALHRLEAKVNELRSRGLDD